jgi:hypothetical protein
MAGNTTANKIAARRRLQARQKRSDITAWLAVRYLLCSSGNCAVLADNKKSSDSVFGVAISGAV